jgi:hypothetical protein
MIQDIIVYSLIVLSVGIVIYRIIKSYRKPKDPCKGCGSDCAGCQFKDIIDKEKK